MSLCGEADFAAVWSFLTVAGEACALDANAFTIPDLASHLEDAHEAPELLKELYCKLLRRAVRSFRPNNWEKYLIKFCHDRGNRRDGWELERFGYRKASARVKLRVLKNLLEHQFVCNPKFKAAVNKMENRTLRLNPIGRDNKGRCYWLQKDHRANVRLYREDQDEETWKLIASDRASLMEVIMALKSGKSPVDSSIEPVLNEDSNSLGSPCASGQTNGEENSIKNNSPVPFEKSDTEDVTTTDKSDTGTDENSVRPKNASKLPDTQSKSGNSTTPPKFPKLSTNNADRVNRIEEKVDPDISSKSEEVTPQKATTIEENENSTQKAKDVKMDCSPALELTEKRIGEKHTGKLSDGAVDCVGEEIEEKVMIVKGDGDGAACESLPVHYFSEEIEEEVMYIYGVGSGNECTMGNPSVESSKSTAEEPEEVVNDADNQNTLPNDEIKNKAENSSTDKDLTDSKNEFEESAPIVGGENDSTEQLPSECNSVKEGLEGKTAPLPFSKRFLQNIPKSNIKESSDLNTLTVKNKLWSVDSLCGSSQSDESPEKNMDISNETVLLNKNSTIDIVNDSVNIISSSNNEKSDINNVKGGGSVNSVACDSDDKIVKTHNELNSNENINFVNCDKDDLKNEHKSDKSSDSLNVQSELSEKSELNNQNNTSIAEDSSNKVLIEQSSNVILKSGDSKSSIMNVNVLHFNMQNASSLGASTLNIENDKMPLDASLIEKSVLNSEKSQETDIPSAKKIHSDDSNEIVESLKNTDGLSLSKDELNTSIDLQTILTEKNENLNVEIENESLLSVDRIKDLPVENEECCDENDISVDEIAKKNLKPPISQEKNTSHIDEEVKDSSSVVCETEECSSGKMLPCDVKNDEHYSINDAPIKDKLDDSIDKSDLPYSIKANNSPAQEENNSLIDRNILNQRQNENSPNLDTNPSVSVEKTNILRENINELIENNTEALSRNKMMETTEAENVNIKIYDDQSSKEEITMSPEKQVFNENACSDSFLSVVKAHRKEENITIEDPKAASKIDKETIYSTNPLSVVEVKEVSKIEDTYCSANRLSNVEDIKDIIKIGEETDCYTTPLSVKEEVKEASKTEGTYCSTNTLSNIENVKEISKKEEEIDYSTGPLSAVEEVKEASKIVDDIDCSNNLLSNIENVKEISEREEETDCFTNPLSVVEEIKDASKLEEDIDGSNNSLSNIEDIKEISKIRETDCSTNPLSIDDNVKEASKIEEDADCSTDTLSNVEIAKDTSKIREETVTSTNQSSIVSVKEASKIENSNCSTLSNVEIDKDNSKIEEETNCSTNQLSVVEEVKEASKLEVKEASKIEEVKEASKIEEVKEASMIEEVKEASKIEEVKEASKLEEVKEASKIEEVKEASRIEEVKEASKIEEDNDCSNNLLSNIENVKEISKSEYETDCSINLLSVVEVAKEASKIEKDADCSANTLSNVEDIKEASIMEENTKDSTNPLPIAEKVKETTKIEEDTICSTTQPPILEEKINDSLNLKSHGKHKVDFDADSVEMRNEKLETCTNKKLKLESSMDLLNCDEITNKFAEKSETSFQIESQKSVCNDSSKVNTIEPSNIADSVKSKDDSPSIAAHDKKGFNPPKEDDSGILAKKVKTEHIDSSESDKLNNPNNSVNSKINDSKQTALKIEEIENTSIENAEVINEPNETSDTTSEVTLKQHIMTESPTDQPLESSIEESKKSEKKVDTEESTFQQGVRTRRSESLKDTKVPDSTNVEKSKVETVSPKTKRSRLAKEENVEDNKINTKVRESRKRGRDESESLSDLEEPSVGQSKKFKPKQKIINPKLRKKVEEKKTTQDLSSEDENDASSAKAKKSAVAGNPMPDKKPTNKRGRKEKGNKSKAKDEIEKTVEQVEDPPVRQSRRIALLKIKEEAQRRLMEEMALRELKAQHNKKNSKNKDQDWQKSSSEHSSDEAFAAKKASKKLKKHEELWKKKGIGWHSSSGGNDTDTEPGEEPEDDFDEQADEDILVSKSDHEFSPESDVECEEWTPVRRARTLKKEDGEEEEVGGGCVKCGKTDHPEWILLCDSCDAGWHASCLKPVLFLIPEGEWYCPPCNHKTLIESLEVALDDHDKQVDVVKSEDLKRKKTITTQSLNKIEASDSEDDSEEMSEESEKISSESCSSNSSSDDEKIYRLRERRQLPISYRFKEYDQLISSAIKEEYKEVDNSGAGNQGRGKDISTIIEADKEEKKAMLEAEQAGENEGETKAKRRNTTRPRRKPRKLNSLDVVSDDCDDNSDEDFKETGWSTSSSEEIVSDHTESNSSSSDSSAPLKRSTRTSRAQSKRINAGSSDRKKKNRRILDSTSESSSDMEVLKKKKQKTSREKGDSSQKSKKRRKEKRSENFGNVDGSKGKAKVKYGGLSDSSKSSHDWSPAHRTRQRKYNYMELPNTESEDEAHKPSGKHMDSSDEYKGESDSSDTDSSRGKRAKALLDEGVANSKEAYQKQLQSHDQSVSPVKTKTNKAKRGKSSDPKIVEDSKRSIDESLPADPNTETPLLEIGKIEGQVAIVASAKSSLTPLQAERERKRMEKLMEKEKRKEERLKKKEEKQQIKDQKAKEREEKKLAKFTSPEQNFGGLQQNFTLTTPIPIRQAVGFPRTPIQPMHPNFIPQSQIMPNLRSPMPQFPNPMRPRMEHPNLMSHIQQIDKGGIPPENREQAYNYHRPPLLNSQILPPKREGPENDERARLIEDRKPMPSVVDFRPFAIDSRKGFPLGPQTAFADTRGISPNFDSHSPGPRPFHPMYAGESNDNPILRENLQSRPVINNSIDNMSNTALPRNGVPIADLSADHKHIPPLRADLDSNSPHLPGQESTTPKRRGRGPGKKTLARQAAAALVTTPEGSSPSPSNSPLMEGTLTVAGAPQPFRPNVDPPSVITRMPHMMPPPYRGSMYNSGQIFGAPRPLGNHIAMGAAYRPHHPHPHVHPLDPSPSGGGPISMTSPERSSPHNPYSPYQSPYYPPASTPPQIGHYPPPPPPHGRYPGPPIQVAPSSSPRAPNTPESGDGEEKIKAPREHAEPSQFIKSEIKQEPLNIKQSSSPTEEMEESNSNERRSVEPDEQPSNFSTANIPPASRPIHPQIKHTESKSERGGRSRLSLTTAARYPQGPYAPQYGPYAPHPPPVPEVSYLHPHHSNHPPQHLASVHRPMYSHHPAHIGPVPMPTRPPNILPLAEHLSPEDAPPNVLPPHAPPGMIPGPHGSHGEETSEFGGLVSYFSSQREDDIDT